MLETVGKLMLGEKILGLNDWGDLFSWETNRTIIIKSKNGSPSISASLWQPYPTVLQDYSAGLPSVVAKPSGFPPGYHVTCSSLRRSAQRSGPCSVPRAGASCGPPFEMWM